MNAATAPSAGEPAGRPYWVDLSELPVAEELLGEPSPLLENPLAPRAGSWAGYLQSQFYLCRYEGTERLRQAIQQFRTKPEAQEEGDFEVYTKVYIRGYTFAKKGAACRLSFSTERSSNPIDWSNSSRLIPGSLVVLSPLHDKFKDICLVATVASRWYALPQHLKPDRKPRVDLFWATEESAKLDPTTEFIMLEVSGSYYESVRWPMVGLQQAWSESTPFQKYIVDSPEASSINMPRYLQHVDAAPRPVNAPLLDTSQYEAYKAMTSRELAIVQGPPGTGKTFTSVTTIDNLVQTLENFRRSLNGPPGPIIIAAQTNHALDQLLHKCMNAGVSIARLGSRTRDDDVKEFSMYNLHKKSSVPKGEVKDNNKPLARLQRQLSEYIQGCLPTYLVSRDTLLTEGIITEAQHQSLDDDEWESSRPPDECEPMAKWLGHCIESIDSHLYAPSKSEISDSELNEFGHKQLAEQDENESPVKGPWQPVAVLWKDRPLDETEQARAKWHATRQDLYDVRPADRGKLYRWYRSKLFRGMEEKWRELIRQYNIACANHKTALWTEYARTLEDGRIQPRIMMVEEAAETMEAQIVSALYPSLEQLLLVGDHQQLVPRPSVPCLAREPYNMHVSLFQRLVTHWEYPYTVLCHQRRMAPIIRQVAQAFYPELKDHPAVHLHQPVPGMGDCQLWWYQHKEPCQQRLQSFINIREASMIIGLASHLIQSGTNPTQITVLSYYSQQVAFIKTRMAHHALKDDFAHIHVVTVDGFQGQENDVIMLSLVRGTAENAPGNVGFVKNENRATVALSRARCGLYVFGNDEQLLAGGVESVETWGKVLSIVTKLDCLGEFLPIWHQDQALKISIPDHWPPIRSQRSIARPRSPGSDLGSQMSTVGSASVVLSLQNMASTTTLAPAALPDSDDLIIEGFRKFYNKRQIKAPHLSDVLVDVEDGSSLPGTSPRDSPTKSQPSIKEIFHQTRAVDGAREHISQSNFVLHQSDPMNQEPMD